jgi:hypothetical protein
MCCLRYEHEFYVQQRKRFPKEGKVVTTARGEEKVLVNDIFRERVTLRGTDGETRVVALLDLRREMGVERTVEQPLDDEPVQTVLDEIPEEVIRLQDTSELPVWMPRPSAPRPAGRSLPVAEPDSGHSARPSRDAEAGDSHGDAPAAGAGGSGAPPAGEAVAPEGEDRGPSGRRRRRRGRRGGRRGRGGGMPGMGRGDGEPDVPGSEGEPGGPPGDDAAEDEGAPGESGPLLEGPGQGDP